MTLSSNWRAVRSAEIALGKAILCRAGAQRRFPSDKALKRLRADAFAGIPADRFRRCGSGRGPHGSLPEDGPQPQRRQIDPGNLRAASRRRTRAEAGARTPSRERTAIPRLCLAELATPCGASNSSSRSPPKRPEEQQIEQIYRYGYLAECNDAAGPAFGLEKAGQLTGWRLNDLAPLSNPSVREANLYAIRSKPRSLRSKTAPVDRDGSGTTFCAASGELSKTACCNGLGNRTAILPISKHRTGARCLRTADGGSAGDAAICWW